ncbi:MAG: 6-phosphogluconolactonase [Pirellulaceae bacterium]|nr:MAG: 6-phosphogluconolactonase [Pirellulaceae bacterium]
MRWLRNMTCLTLLGAVLSAGHHAGAVAPGTWAIIGTYTEESKPGVFVFRFDPESGQLESASAARGVRNPSFLAVHPTQPWVYAVSEIGDFQGRRTGAVAAFEWQAATETLRLLGQEPSGGDGPCHISVDPQGRAVLVAHYAGGSVSCLPILAGGRLGPVSSLVQHTGSSVHPRQTAPHAHSIYVAPGGRFVVAADLGTDRVLIYAWDAQNARLVEHQPRFVAIQPGSGPRHLAFHPNGRTCYVINELSNTITVLGFDATQGRFETVQTISTLPENYQEASYTAEVVVHPSGKWVFGSNRGHDSLAIFRVDEATGRLSAAGHCLTGGKTPRNFALDPTGNFVVVANQNSDNVNVFRFDATSGRLEPVGVTVSVPKPVCIRWLQARR